MYSAVGAEPLNRTLIPLRGEGVKGQNVKS
jgi:hypothetical protein